MQIRLENVNYIYQPKTPFFSKALDNVSLEIPHGQFVALVGHSGSGKSTLSQVICGLLPATNGKVWVNEQIVSRKNFFYQVGLVFQYPEQQFFAETVREEVGFAAKNKGLTDDEIEQVVVSSLAKVGLSDVSFLDRSPFALSGGQRRRVALAGVLAMNPQILIFDEPTAGLDGIGKKWLMDLVKVEQQSGKTIIWITHNMDEAACLAERILVMNKGQIALDGSPYEVFANEQKLAKLGLQLPIVAQLLRQLRAGGLSVSAQGLTVEEAFAEIKAALLTGGIVDDC